MCCPFCFGSAPQVLAALSLLFAGPVADKGRFLFRLFDYGSSGVCVCACKGLPFSSLFGAPSMHGDTLVNCMPCHHATMAVWLLMCGC
jgi:hypothetical protein